MKVKFKQWQCIAKPAQYANGRKAIRLVDSFDNKPIATATVNLVDATPTSNNYIFVKNWSENEGMIIALTGAGIIKLKKPTQVIQTGHVFAYEFELTKQALKELFQWEK